MQLPTTRLVPAEQISEEAADSLNEQLDRLITLQTQKNSDNVSSNTDLETTLVTRFGPIAGGYLSNAARKIYQISPAEISGDALRMTLFQRVRIADDTVADELKKNPQLDMRVASS